MPSSVARCLQHTQVAYPISVGQSPNHARRVKPNLGDVRGTSPKRCVHCKVGGCLKAADMIEMGVRDDDITYVGPFGACMGQSPFDHPLIARRSRVDEHHPAGVRDHETAHVHAHRFRAIRSRRELYLGDCGCHGIAQRLHLQSTVLGSVRASI